MPKQQQDWDLVIQARRGWLDLGLRDIWRYRDLALLFVKRDLSVVYKQTILGPLWFFLQPLFSTAIFTLVFSHIAKISTDGIPQILFYLSGLVCWNYFSECVIATSNTFVTNASIFGKVYFPRLIIPISVVTSNLIKFAIQCTLLIAGYVYFATQGTTVRPAASLIIVPMLVLQMAILGLGFGILISSLTTKYRDLGLLLGFGMQLWMYATPIVYPLSQVPEKYRYLFDLNPMASVIGSFRTALFDVGAINSVGIQTSWGITLLILALGILLFSRIERSFMDTI